MLERDELVGQCCVAGAVEADSGSDKFAVQADGSSGELLEEYVDSSFEGVAVDSSAEGVRTFVHDGKDSGRLVPAGNEPADTDFDGRGLLDQDDAEFAAVMFLPLYFHVNEVHLQMVEARFVGCL